MTHHAAHQYTHALAAFRRAEEIESNNPLAKYHMAHVYLALGEDEKALKQLTVLKELVPREANVHLLMGKIWKKRGKVNHNTDTGIDEIKMCEGPLL